MLHTLHYYSFVEFFTPMGHFLGLGKFFLFKLRNRRQPGFLRRKDCAGFPDNKGLLPTASELSGLTTAWGKPGRSFPGVRTPTGFSGMRSLFDVTSGVFPVFPSNSSLPFLRKWVWEAQGSVVGWAQGEVHAPAAGSRQFEGLGAGLAVR